MSPDFLKTIFLPLALMIIMFGMGMTLTVADFKRVILAPKAKILGLLIQLVLLPVVAYALVLAFGLSSELAIGLMLIAACPGGPTSNMISHLAKGDTALSVTLTAVSSVVTVFTIPLIVGVAMELFQLDGAVVALPFGKTVLQLMLVTIVPISFGMMVHRFFPKFSVRMSRPVNVLSVIFLALVILAAVLKEKDLAAQFKEVGFAVLALNVITMSLGFGLAGWLKLSLRQQVTISIEAGIQNGTLALAIALGILESARIAVPSVVYSLLMFASGAFMIVAFGRSRRVGEK
ncbi:MAG TPA: bile acid:sodium symporter family protein [Kiritimatiellia bacterium]|mgnify:CR=1 FL=1|nr:bile acid:sodium symporter family protein [Kiritimatiellia bacterium]